MSETKHTPGPWMAVRNNAYWEVNPQHKTVGGPFSVADCCPSDPEHPDGGLQEANARLIAAAPTMLEALLAVREVDTDECRHDHHGLCQTHSLRQIERDGEWVPECEMALVRAAIAKATGADA